MKSILTIFLTIFILYPSYAQSPEQRKAIDSLRSLLSNKQHDTLRVLRMAELAKLYGDEKPDSLLILSVEPLLLAKKIDYKRGIALLLSRQAGAYGTIGNKAKALELYLEAIRISEKINDFENLHSANNGIGNTYSNENPRKALIYHWKAKELAEKIGNQDGVTQVLYNIGGDYRKLKVYDSAKMYTMMSFDKASALKSHRMMGPPLYGMGMIYTATDQLSLALEHFRTGASYCVSAKNYNHLSRIYQGMAYAFNKLGQTDSTLIYAKLALSISRESHFIGRIPPLADVIYDAYKRLGNKDSALAYVEMSKIFKDSAHIEENQKHMQALTAEEYVRQQEKAEEDLKTNEERRRNIQYAAIALALLVFIILFLLLSHSVVANQKLIRFLGIMALLLVFEFLNLLLHPYVGTLTHHSPFLMLAIMVAIGALLIPIHHKLEKVIIDRLVEKNKKIRLNAAKKTISKLENLNS